MPVACRLPEELLVSQRYSILVVLELCRPATTRGIHVVYGSDFADPALTLGPGLGATTTTRERLSVKGGVCLQGVVLSAYAIYYADFVGLLSSGWTLR